MILWKALAEGQVSSLRLKGEDYLMKDGTFRKKKGFTAVQNSVAKDKTLSMKAKGLYSFKKSIIEALFVAVREMLDEVPSKIQGRNVCAKQVITLIDKRMDYLMRPPHIGICQIIESTMIICRLQKNCD